MIDCTHSKYRLAPSERTKPILNYKGSQTYVSFDTVLPLNVHKMYFWTGILTSCSEREHEVAQIFHCMKYLFPVITPWYIHGEEIRDHGDKVLSNYIAGKYCVDDGKAFVTYAKPSHAKEDYIDILTDICDASILVEGYNDLRADTYYEHKAIPFTNLRDSFYKLCANTHIFCYAKYKIDGITYKKHCVNGQILKNNGTHSEVIVVATKSIHRDLAILSRNSYKDNLSDTEYPNKWKYLDRDSDITGFLGYAVKDQDAKKIVIVYRGTDEMNDWVFGNVCFKFWCTPWQYYSALKFYNSIKSHHQDYDIMLTGHSLGGALAQLVAFEKEVTAVSFDTPGIYRALPWKYTLTPELVEQKGLKVTAYISGINLVNRCCPHAVDLIDLQSDIADSCRESIESYTLMEHGVDKIVSLFDPLTGYPLNSKRVAKNEASGYFLEQDQRCYHDTLHQEIHEFDKAVSALQYVNSITVNVTNKMAYFNAYVVIPSSRSVSESYHYDRILNYKKMMAEQHLAYKSPCAFNDLSWGASNFNAISYEDSYTVHMVTATCDLSDVFDYNHYRHRIEAMQDEFNVTIVEA